MVNGYRAKVTREDDFWVAVVHGVPGWATEARHLADLDGEVRDLLSGLLEVDGDSLDIDYDLSGAIGQAAARVTEYREACAQLGEAQDAYEATQERVVRELRKSGVRLRDAAGLLDVSFQRAQQVTANASRARRKVKSTRHVKESA